MFWKNGTKADRLLVESSGTWRVVSVMGSHTVYGTHTHMCVSARERERVSTPIRSLLYYEYSTITL